jgi:short-subunit dehydrogenase
MLVTRSLLPIIQKSDFGQILNVVSVSGIEIPFDYYHTIYSATKFGLQGFSEALAKEFENKSLRIMGYYPGGMSTKLFKKAGQDYKDNEPWMFDPKESVEAMIFMLTRNPKINIKRMDLINHLQK